MRRFFTLFGSALVASTALADITAPEGLQTDTWYLCGNQGGTKLTNVPVQVGFDGDDIYITDMPHDAVHDLWMKGTDSGSGSYTFSNELSGTSIMYGTSYQIYFSADAYTLTPVEATMSETDGVKTLEFSTEIYYYLSEGSYWGNIWDITISSSEAEINEPVMNENVYSGNLPYKNNFSSEAKRSEVGCYDANNDSFTFDYGADWDENNAYMVLNCDTWQQSDDYLVLPGITLEAGVPYNFAFDARSNSGGWIYYEVLMGKQAKQSALSTKITEYTSFCYNTSWETAAFEDITVAETGTYYIAIHCTAYGYSGYFSVDNLLVEAVDTEKPEQVAMFNITPDRNCALSASIVAQMPGKTIGGNTYASGKQLTYTLSRNGNDIATGTSTANGLVMLSDNNEDGGIVNGFNEYSIVVSDGEHISKATSTRAFIGQDEPLNPNNIQIASANGIVTISWDPVTSGSYGYQVGNVTYEVWDGNKYNGTKINDEPITGTEYSFEYNLDEGDQGLKNFYVFAINNAGESYGASASIFAGAPYALPYNVHFTYDDEFFYDYNSMFASAYVDRWNEVSSDGDGASLSMSCYGSENYADFITGKVNIANTVSTLSFDYRSEGTATVSIYAIDSEGNKIDISTFDIANTSDEFKTATVTISGITADWATIHIRYVFESYYDYTYMDNIAIVAESTGLDNIAANRQNDIYNLNGIKVKNAEGFVIKNGKMIIVK